MTGELLWPGDRRALTVFTPPAYAAALVRVEVAWLRVLGEEGLAPTGAADRLAEVELTPEGLADLETGTEGAGNPVLPLLAVLRGRLAPDDARWLHRGLTSQDVVDTALLLCARDALDGVDADLRRLTTALATLAATHRDTPMVGRTLTQHAVPITFGLKVAGWLGGVLDAADAVRRVRGRLPVQCGGAAGTLAAVVELAASAGAADPAGAALGWAARFAEHLGLQPAPPWHTRRTPVTAVGDALVQVSDALGHLAGDVALLSRTEIAELGEPVAAGRGGSTSMPHKRNPVLAVLVRRAAATAPLLGAQLHLAAAQADDERSAGPWHTEWEPLAMLARHTVAAAAQTVELCEGLHVDADAMAATLDRSLPDVLAEQRAVRELLGAPPAAPEVTGYLGASGRLVDDAVAAARSASGERR